MLTFLCGLCIYNEGESSKVSLHWLVVASCLLSGGRGLGVASEGDGKIVVRECCDTDS